MAGAEDGGGGDGGHRVRREEDGSSCRAFGFFRWFEDFARRRGARETRRRSETGRNGARRSVARSGLVGVGTRSPYARVAGGDAPRASRAPSESPSTSPRGDARSLERSVRRGGTGGDPRRGDRGRPRRAGRAGRRVDRGGRRAGRTLRVDMPRLWFPARASGLADQLSLAKQIRRSAFG